MTFWALNFRDTELTREVLRIFLAELPSDFAAGISREVSVARFGAFLGAELGLSDLTEIPPPPIWRKFKRQHDQGQRDWEPLRGKSASESVSERTSENL